MTITNKVTVLWLAFDGFFQKDPLKQNEAEMLFQFEDEIAEYFKKHLPEQHQVYGNGNISHLKHITEKLFKSSNPELKAEIYALLIKVSLGASFIPDDKQEMTSQKP
jgi:hypothetical protein